MRNIIKNIFEIDLRALGFFRIGFGIILFWDIAIRAFDIENHYTDFGILPIGEALKIIDNYAFSIHLANETFLFQTVLFFLSFLFIIALTFGYKTRLSTITTWFLLISLQNRNTMILNGADGLKIILLFWSSFLPMGAHYSMDSITRKNSQKLEKTHFSLAGTGLLLMSVAIFFFSFFYKTGKEWYPDGTALYYALHIGSNVTHLGVWFRQFDLILKIGTYATLCLEFFAPILIFTTFLEYRIRLLMVGVLIIFQIGIALFLSIGAYPFLNLLTPFLFIPKKYWDILESNLFFIKTSNWFTAKFSKMKLFLILSTEKDYLHNNKFADRFSFVILGLLIFWNVAVLPSVNIKVPSFIKNTLTLLGLKQNWNMYGPRPHNHSGWYLISGKLMDGTEVDVTRKKNGKVDYSRPKYLLDTYPNERWRKYLDQTRFRYDSKRQLLNYGRYICRSWNRGKPEKEKLGTFQIHFMREKTLPNYQKAEVLKETLWYFDCFLP